MANAILKIDQPITPRRTLVQQIRHLDTKGVSALLRQMMYAEHFVRYSYYYFLRRKKGIQTVYALDSDLFFPLIKPRVAGLGHSFATRYVLSRLHGSFYIPPGSFSELVVHLEDLCKVSHRFRGFAYELNAARRDDDLTALAQEVVQTLSETHGLRDDRQLEMLAESLKLSGRRATSITVEVAKAIIRAARPHIGFLETLYRFFDENEFVDVPQELAIGARAVRDDVRLKLAGVPKRGSEHLRNIADAVNVASVVANRQRFNAWLRDGRKGSASCYWMELMTTTPSLFRLSLDPELCDDEFLEEEGELDPSALQTERVVTAPWDVFFVCVVAGRFDLDSANLQASSMALRQIQHAQTFIRQLRSSKLHKAHMTFEEEIHLAKDRLDALLHSLELHEILQAEQAENMIKGLKGYWENSDLENLRRLMDASAHEQWEAAHVQHSRKPARELLRTTSRLSDLTVELLRFLGRAAPRGEGAAIRIPCDTGAESPASLLSTCECDAPEVVARRFKIKYNVAALSEARPPIAWVDWYDAYYSIYWEHNVTLDEFYLAMRLLASRPAGDTVFTRTMVWTPGGRIVFDRMFWSARSLRRALSARTAHPRPLWIRVETEDAVISIDITGEERGGRRRIGVIASATFSSAVATLILETKAVACTHDMLRAAIETALVAKEQEGEP